jgi:hypothetical protein
MKICENKLNDTAKREKYSIILQITISGIILGQFTGFKYLDTGVSGIKVEIYLEENV